MRRGLLPLLLAAVASARDADFGEEALRARVEALRPDVEAALDAPLGEAVDIRASAPGVIREILAKELEAQRGAIDGGPRGEALRETCAQEALLASQILLAKVDLSTGAIHVCPENFRRIAALDESWKGLLSQDALDAVLMHEMVHVFQVRRFGLARFVGAPPSIEALTARSAVIEGHAQYVGRIAAERRGLEEAAALIDRTQTEVPASIEDPALRHFAQIVGANLAFAYVEGEKFVGGVAAKLGYAKAVERIFESPPGTLRAVSNPEEYLAPRAPDTSLDGISSLVERLLAERGGTTRVVPFAMPALRAALAPAGREVADAAMRAYEKGLAIVSAGDPKTTVAFLCGRDEAAGKILYDADVATSRAKDELFGKPGGEIRIVSADYRDVSFEGASGIEASKTVEIGAGLRQRIETVLARRGPLVLEAMVMDADAPGQATRLAREVLELMRGAEVADPWDGKGGDEARKALLEALGDPHWGVRWRATRNLARMKADPGIDAALERMLGDADASVACDALRALVRRGWSGAVTETRAGFATHELWEVRLAYQRTMAEQETDEEARASRLLAALEDGHPAVRAYAFGKLADLGMNDRIPWERLRAGIEDADGVVRVAAVEALGWRELPPDARDVLLGALGDGNLRVRDAVVASLDRWIDDPRVLEALIRSLEDESSRVRRSAAIAIRDASGAAAALPALVRLLDDEFAGIAAAETLGKIGIADPEAIAKLETILRVPDLRRRFEAARALRRLGRDPRDLAPVFAEALRKANEWTRRDAAEELGTLGEAARPHVADLAAALKDEDEGVREAAAEALGNLGAVAEDALPALDALGG
ncbi:MAG: HEAT repeat domain-containing protein, partial [Planctomycetes bacterium]|nr:HEAT repeat domain-containing protein [Planctomycetota bacterium]